MESNITVTKLLTKYVERGQTEGVRQDYRVLYAFGLISPEAHGKLMCLMDKLDYINSAPVLDQSSFTQRVMNFIRTMNEAREFDERGY